MVEDVKLDEIGAWEMEGRVLVVYGLYKNNYFKIKLVPTYRTSILNCMYNSQQIGRSEVICGSLEGKPIKKCRFFLAVFK